MRHAFNVCRNIINMYRIKLLTYHYVFKSGTKLANERSTGDHGFIIKTVTSRRYQNFTRISSVENILHTAPFFPDIVEDAARNNRVLR